MMTSDEKFKRAMKVILLHEGLFSDHPEDPGGATKYGISLRYLKAIGFDVNLDGKVDIKDVMKLDESTARFVYRRGWWDKYRYNKIDDSIIATKVFDMAVNMGHTQAHKLVQRALNRLSLEYRDIIKPLIIDGVLGEKSFTAINDICKAGHASVLLNAIRAQCRDFYLLLVKYNSNLQVFLDGWMNRANS